ncbi:MAG TPA: FAD-dependent oxidoreductase, partial [Gemmata sp.]
LDPREVEFPADRVRVPSLGLDARALILCRGFTTDPDPWFGAVTFNAAKGEFLTVRVPGLTEARVVHRGVWLAPMGADLFRAGATYSWEPLDAQPTPEGRAELESKLRAVLRLPFEVVAHHAAVRPVVSTGLPVLGRHPVLPQLAYFNGLGSKGSLLAPFFADQLARHLCGTGASDPAVNVSRFLVHPTLPGGYDRGEPSLPT